MIPEKQKYRVQLCQMCDLFKQSIHNNRSTVGAMRRIKACEQLRKGTQTEAEANPV